MGLRLLVSVTVSMVFVFPSSVRAYDLSLELLSDTELTVEQTFWYDLNGWNPVGEPLLVWGRLTNSGNDVVQLTGIGHFIRNPGNSWPFVDEYNPVEYFDPEMDPDDPFIRNKFGDYALELEAGESVDFPFNQIWGLSYLNYPTFALPVGTTGHVDGGRIAYWEFDRSPNNPLDGPPTVFIELDQGFTVTVIPEPTTVTLVGCLVLITSASRRHIQLTPSTSSKLSSP